MKKSILLIIGMFILIITAYSQKVKLPIYLINKTIIEKVSFQSYYGTINAYLIDSRGEGYLLWELNQEDRIIASIFIPLKGENFYIGKDFPFFSVNGINIINDKRIKKVKLFDNSLKQFVKAVKEAVIKEKCDKNKKYWNSLRFILSGDFDKDENKNYKKDRYHKRKSYFNKYCSDCSEELKDCDNYNEDKYRLCMERCGEIGGTPKEKRDCERMCLKLNIEGFRNCWNKYHDCRMKCTPDPK